MGASLNYTKVRDFLFGLGLMAESTYAISESAERALLYDVWKVIKGD